MRRAIVSSAALSASGLLVVGAAMYLSGDEPHPASGPVPDRGGESVAEPRPPTAADERAPALPDAVLLYYDAARDLFTIRASRVPLGTLLERVAAATGVEFVGLEALHPDELLTIDLDPMPLARAIDQILLGFDKILVYSDPSGSRGAGAAVGAVVVGRRAPESLEVAPAPVDPAAALVDAVASKDAELAMRIVEGLRKSGADAEIERAAKRIADLIDRRTGGTGSTRPPPDDRLAYQVLNGLAPELAVQRLAEQAAPSAETPLPGTAGGAEGEPAALDPAELRSQLAAIAMLGQIGGPGAVAPLMRVFESSDPMIRKIAAEALAAIAEPVADAFLLEASRDPSPDWGEPAAMAIAFRGSSELKAALAEGIRSGEVPVENTERVAGLLGRS